MLHTFFNTMDGGPVDDNNYLLDGPNQMKIPAHHDFWTEEPLNTYNGSNMNFSQAGNEGTILSRPYPNVPYSPTQDLEYDPSLNPIVTSAEILEAASTLFNNGHVEGQFDLQDFYAPRSQEYTHHSRDMFPRDRSSKIVTSEPFPEMMPTFRSPALSWLQQDPSLMNGPTVLPHMYYEKSPRDMMQLSSMKAQAQDIRWGSDAAFLGPGFVAPPHQETVENVTRTILHNMECLEPQESAANTRPPSPFLKRRIGFGDVNHDEFHQPNMMMNQTEDGDEDTALQRSLDSRPRKRRKGKVKEEDPDDQYAAHRVQSKRGKFSSTKKSAQAQRCSVENISLKSGESQSGEQKSNRENLTEEQKRSNHILSEQKRRNLIKQGFDDLCGLVPELKGGSYSKSAMLALAADWLEELVRGNERLKDQLAEFDHRTSY